MTRRFTRIALAALMIGSLSGCGVSLSQTHGAMIGGNFGGHLLRPGKMVVLGSRLQPCIHPGRLRGVERGFRAQYIQVT